MPGKIIVTVGTRPNFVKCAPLMRAIGRRPGLETVLVHTGQHHDTNLSRRLFEDLDIPAPDVDLAVNSGTEVARTAEIMRCFEPVVREQRPDMVVVCGDVDSTLACAITARKLGVTLAHVEAGLRSFDRSMPEELNRVVTDAIADLHFAPCATSVANLQREGIGSESTHLVGNVMIDSLLANRTRAGRTSILETLKLVPGDYGVVTLHRPSNVDDEGNLIRIMQALCRLQQHLPLVFPVHPRTRRRLEGERFAGLLREADRIIMTDPLGYLDFVKLLSDAALVLTDSGGIQEETTVLGVPCLTLRANTERPVTVEQGTNRLIGTDPGQIVAESTRVLSSPPPAFAVPPLWDGQASERIAGVIAAACGPRPGCSVT